MYYVQVKGPDQRKLIVDLRKTKQKFFQLPNIYKKFIKPQKLSIVRAKSTSKEVIDAYYAELKVILVKNDRLNKPECIYNVTT